MSDLKACPICNADMKYIKTPGGFYQVADSHAQDCALSGADLVSYHTLEELIAEWNNRPHENKLKADAVREAIDSVAWYDDRTLIKVGDVIKYANKLERGEL